MNDRERVEIQAIAREAAAAVVEELFADSALYQRLKAQRLEWRAAELKAAAGAASAADEWAKANRPPTVDEWDAKHGGGRPLVDLNGSWWVHFDGATRSTVDSCGMAMMKPPPADETERRRLQVLWATKRLEEVEHDLDAWYRYANGGASPRTWRPRRYPGFAPHVGNDRRSRPATDHVAHLIEVKKDVLARFAELGERPPSVAALTGGTPSVDEMTGGRAGAILAAIDR